MSQGASASVPLMLTYPGFDTPDGRSRAPTVDEVLASLKAGHKVTVSPTVFSAPVHMPPGMGESPDDLALVVWEPNPIEVLLEREAERHQQQLMAALLQLWNAYQELLRQQELEAKRKEEEELRKMKEEEERKRRHEELEQQKKIEDALKLAELKKIAQGLKQELDTLKATSKLNPVLFADRLAILNPRLDGEAGLETLNKNVRTYISMIRRQEPKHAEVAQKIALCPYIHNKLLAQINLAADAILLNEQAAKKISDLDAEYNKELTAYKLQLEHWKTAIDRTKERIAFLHEKSRPKQMEAIGNIEKLAAQNPFQKDYSDALVKLNNELTENVRRIEKARLKNDETKRIIQYFVASEAPHHLNRRNYSNLAEYEKALIRAVRQGQGVASVHGVTHSGANYGWDQKTHDYRGATPPTFSRGKPNAREYRLFLSTSPHPTTMSAGGVICGLTGERLTSVGTSNTDDMLFFHCDHGSSNGYQYGVITNLPLRRDKTADKPACLPADFPNAPDPVIT